MTPHFHLMPLKSAILASGLLFTATAACAQDQDSGFAGLDVDGSGGLSLEEVQAAVPDVTTETFAAYDTDASGDLSTDEFAVWAQVSQGDVKQ